jgi:hypothetical protein
MPLFKPSFKDDWSGLKDFPEYRPQYLKEKRALKERQDKIDQHKGARAERRGNAKKYIGTKKQR